MTYTPEQISQLVLKALKEIETPDVLSLSYDEKLALAQNPNTSPESLQTLATDENSDVRYWVATNPNTPAEVLQTLATDEDSSVRYWVAQNPNYKSNKTLELTSEQFNALKELIKSGQNPVLKSLL